MKLRFFNKETGEEIKTIPGNMLVINKYGTILEYGESEHDSIISHNTISLREDAGIELIPEGDSVSMPINSDSKRITVYCPIIDRNRLVESCDCRDDDCMCIGKFNLPYSKSEIETAYKKTETKYRHKNFPKTVDAFCEFINDKMKTKTFSMSTSYIWRDYRNILRATHHRDYRKMEIEFYSKRNGETVLIYL